jgi:hypothetical protein
MLQTPGGHAVDGRTDAFRRACIVTDGEASGGTLASVHYSDADRLHVCAQAAQSPHPPAWAV